MGRDKVKIECIRKQSCIPMEVSYILQNRVKYNRYSCVSLFCGCGGFDLGMIENGIIPIAAYDINNYAINSYNQNLVPVAIQCDLTNKDDFEEISADVIISGSPCQGFSTAGKRRLKDPRNMLFLKAIDIVLKLCPKVFVAENVVGILSGKHKTEYIDVAIERLNRKGYTTSIMVVDCRKLGMAQMRRRALLFAWDTNKRIIVPPPHLSPLSIKDVLDSIPDGIQNHDTKFCSASGINLNIAKNIKPGQKLCNVRKGERALHTWDIPSVFGETTFEEKEILNAMIRVRRKCRSRDWGDSDPVTIENLSHYLGYDPTLQVKSLKKKKFIKDKGNGLIDLANTFNGKFRRLQWDKQSFTVDTRYGSPTQFLHPVEHRAFTVREAARLQGFPDDFLFVGPISAQYEMVGNAVPPPLSRYAAQIALSLLS